MATHIKCYVVIELTDNEPVGIHTFPLTEDGLDDVCDLVEDLWREQELKVDFTEKDIRDQLKSHSYFRKANHHADYAIHVHKATKE